MTKLYKSQRTDNTRWV